jgi:hypothetical protein
MFKTNELEIINVIYNIKNNESSYKNKIAQIQKVISDYINSNRLIVKVDFLDRYIEVTYGITLKRRQSTLDYQNNPEYRKLVLESSFDSVAGLDENDCFNKLENDQFPLYICIETMFTYTIDSFSDQKNGHILDQILNNNRYETRFGFELFDNDNYKPIIRKININDYLTSDDLIKLDNIISVVGVATKVCNDLIDNHLIEPKKYDEDTTAKKYDEDTTAKKYDEDTTAILGEELYDSTYDTKKVVHTVNEIKYYVRQVTGYGNEDIFMNSLDLKTYEDVDKLQCIKQFLRLVHLIMSKMEYNYDYLGNIKDLPIGELHADGHFCQNSRLIKIIGRVIKSTIISTRDLEYIITLYSDKSYVVGLAIKHTDEVKKEPEMMTLNRSENTLKEYSQFA